VRFCQVGFIFTTNSLQVILDLHEGHLLFSLLDMTASSSWYGWSGRTTQADWLMCWMCEC